MLFGIALCWILCGVQILTGPFGLQLSFQVLRIWFNN